MFLSKAQLFASREPWVVTTLLDSSVAVCLWDSRWHWGGINHYLLPFLVDDRNPSHSHESLLRYGNIAIHCLMERLIALGSRKDDLRALVFGGACAAGDRRESPGDALGERNVEVALNILEDEGIDILRADVGGPGERQLLFVTYAGKAWVRRQQAVASSDGPAAKRNELPTERRALRLSQPNPEPHLVSVPYGLAAASRVRTS